MVKVMMSYLKQSLIIFRRLRMTGCLELMSPFKLSSETRWNTACTSDRLECLVM